MRYKTKAYPLDCPEPIWEALTEVQNSDNNVNDELVLAISKHVDDVEREGDLTEQQRQAIREVLDGE